MSRHFAASASAAAAAPSSSSSVLFAEDFDSAAPPSRAQLRSLLAVPSGMVSTMARVRKRGGKKATLAKDGQIVSVEFDALGRRPYPTNGISLEQSITMELSYTLGSTITTSVTPGVPTFAGYSFSLSQFSAVTTLATVFDQYKFEQVEVWLQCNTPNQTTPFPEVMSAVDLDDAGPPTAFSQIEDKPGALLGLAPAGRYHKWRPHMAVAAYSGTFTSYSNMVAGWIDIASPAVQHYGLKVATISNSSTTVSFTLDVRAVISFRSPALN